MVLQKLDLNYIIDNNVKNSQDTIEQIVEIYKND